MAGAPGRHLRRGWRAAVAGAALVALAAGQGPKPQRPEPPKWLDDEGKDLFNDLETADNVYADAACETREKLLKKMAGKGGQDAGGHRSMVLLGLGLCELKKGNYPVAAKRLESCVSEMNVPSEEVMLQNQQVAHIALVKQAAGFLGKHEITQAGTALRRCREIQDRNMKKIVKVLHKQMEGQGQAPPVDLLLDEIPGHGKTGQYMPMLVKQVPGLVKEFAFIEVVDNVLESLDKRIAALDPSLKEKRLRLGVSKGKSKGGALLFVPALPTEAVVPGERFAAAQEVAKGLEGVLEGELAPAEKGATLVKHAKEGSGCKEGKGLQATCKALLAVPDIASNGFGESRLLVLKAGKKQQLDACTTNANVGILLAAKDGAQVKVAGADEAVDLKAGEPVVVDFCREATLEAASTVPVIFAQAWHPEFAAVERTTELRARSKTFGLSEDDVKSTTKVVNDHAKRGWDKSAALWRKESAGHAAIREAFQNELKEKSRKEEEAAEAKQRESEASDEDRQKALEALERKREEKRRKAEEAEQARLRRKQQLEEERAKRDPWLNSPQVRAAEKNLEELKEARRDANAKLEFDLSNQLTRDISAAERALKKVIKQAKKEHKQGGGGGGGGASKAAPEDPPEKAAEAKKEEPKAKAPEPKGGKEKPDAAAKGKESGELKKLREKLAEVKAKKNKAAEAEEFAEAKKLKKQQQELEEKIKKLEL